jgi:hypothetical protein
MPLAPLDTSTMLWPQRPIKPLVLPRTPVAYWVQPKYNGWALVLPGNGTAWTRRGREITNWTCFDNLNLCFDYPLHAELYVAGGVATDVPRLKHGTVKPVIMVHDVMIEGRPIENRLTLLDTVVPREPPWQISQTLTATTWDEINRLFHTMLSQGHEGLVLKKRGSHYHIGRAGSVSLPDWYKIKEEVKFAA